jgi:hypothetical protein
MSRRCRTQHCARGCRYARTTANEHLGAQRYTVHLCMNCAVPALENMILEQNELLSHGMILCDIFRYFTWARLDLTPFHQKCGQG